jgi:hypothetical protein
MPTASNKMHESSGSDSEDDDSYSKMWEMEGVLNKKMWETEGVRKYTLKDFTLHKMLGKGSFGKVHIRFPIANFPLNLLLWAVKMLPPTSFKNSLRRAHRTSCCYNCIHIL